MSGRGRKQPNRKPGTHTSRPASTKGSAPKKAGGSGRPSQGVASPRPVSRAGREERRKRNQKIGVIVGALALAGTAVGSIIAGQAGGSTPAASTSAPPPSEVQAAAPTSSAPTTSLPASPPASAGQAMTVTCPTGAGASPRFGHEITAPTPYDVTIDYGDGDRYTNDSDNLGAIFSHTYERQGTYQVTAVLTDVTGATTSAACTYIWAG